MAQGRSNAEIGNDLFMSATTVQAHVSRILTKLDLNNRTQIALLAHDAGLTDQPRLQQPMRSTPSARSSNHTS